jgi:hypothetical protein
MSTQPSPPYNATAASNPPPAGNETATQPPDFSDSIPTLYDETHRGVWFQEAVIASLGNRANLIAHLEHHSPSTDGSFSVCLAGGAGVFVKQVCIRHGAVPVVVRYTG